LPAVLLLAGGLPNLKIKKRRREKMKIVFSQESLFGPLKRAASIVAGGTYPYKGYFLLGVSEENTYLYSTDLQVALKEPVEVEVQSGSGSVVLPASKLLEILKETDHDQLVLETSEAGDSSVAQWAMLQAGKSRFKLACLPADGYPAWPEFKAGKTVTLEAGVLSDMISRTVYAVGSETSGKYTLNGLLVHIKSDGSINLVGSDGYRLALYTKEAGHNIHQERKLILPRKAATEVGKLANGVKTVTLKINKNHILFEIGDKQLVSTLIEGAYPNYEQVLPQNDKVMAIRREDLLKALKRVSLVSGETKGVKLDLSEDRLLLSSIGGDIGEGQEELPCEYKGDPLTIGFNARFLIESLSAMTEDTVRVSLKESTTAAEIEGDNGIEDYRAVVMPMVL
jgi:DNA polymerase-3 subunit beta